MCLVFFFSISQFAKSDKLGHIFPRRLRSFVLHSCISCGQSRGQKESQGPCNTLVCVFDCFELYIRYILRFYSCRTHFV